MRLGRIHSQTAAVRNLHITYPNSLKHNASSSIIDTEGLVFTAWDDVIVVCCDAQDWLPMPTFCGNNVSLAGVDEVHFLVETGSNQKVLFHMNV